jgi:glucan phosphoethanolaminetransferase (alkaline phosphatase superfamily)
VFGGKAADGKKTKIINAMKLTKKIATKVHSRLPSLLTIAAILALNTLSAFGQAFNSTELKTGISNSLAVIMMFGFVLGIACVIYGGFAIRRGDVDQGKMSIIGGAIIAAAPAVIFAFYKIFGLDANSSVGVGNF